MCRSIKTLFSSSSSPTDEEINQAALQFVRKISGFRKPSKVNETSFNQAIDDISKSSRVFLDSLVLSKKN